MSTPPQDPPTAPSATTPDDAPPKRYLDAPTAQPPNNFPPRALPALAAAASLIRVDDFKTAHTKPCFRDANLWGMATGFAFGGVRFIFGGSVSKSCNWAVASFVGSSILAYEACQYRRRVEKDGMMRVAEVIERKKQLQEQRLAERRERHVRAQEEAAAAAAAEKAKKSSWW